MTDSNQNLEDRISPRFRARKLGWVTYLFLLNQSHGLSVRAGFSL